MFSLAGVEVLRTKNSVSAVVAMVWPGTWLTEALSTRREAELGPCMGKFKLWRVQNFWQRLSLFSCAKMRHRKSPSGRVACSLSTALPGENGGNTCHTVTSGRISGARTMPLVRQCWCAKVWRNHVTAALIAAGLISPLEAYGNEVADKLAERGALRIALTLEFVARVRYTDLQVRVVQTRLIEANLVACSEQAKDPPCRGQSPCAPCQV